MRVFFKQFFSINCRRHGYRVYFGQYIFFSHTGQVFIHTLYLLNNVEVWKSIFLSEFDVYYTIVVYCRFLCFRFIY